MQILLKIDKSLFMVNEFKALIKKDDNISIYDNKSTTEKFFIFESNESEVNIDDALNCVAEYILKKFLSGEEKIFIDTNYFARLESFNEFVDINNIQCIKIRNM